MILEGIKTSSDVKKLSIRQLEILADEIRERIIGAVSKNGGHLASNLGVADLIVALHYCFDFPKDKLLFDVGHQCYAHKILTERNDRFDTIRQDGGLSGFPNIFESEYDAFCSGHAGNSLSACLGYCAARDALGQDYYVVDIVGDASFFNGENLEAATSADKKPKKFIVILNDNEMSISSNNNGLYKIMSSVTTKRSYGRFMSFFSKTIGNSLIGKGLKRVKNFVKRSMNGLSIIDSLGFKYVGIFNGNKMSELVGILRKVKNADRGVLLHLKTVKGKGLADAEENPRIYHGVGKNLEATESDFSRGVGEILMGAAAKDDKITAICAGMKDGVGLAEFEKKFPNRFFDVGIAEEHAVTFAAGQALGGLKPVVCVYSTFLQRAYDQIMQDVCLQNLPVVFMADRAGAVGADGVTHQGLFDLSYLGSIPNMSIFAPKDVEEARVIFDYCLKLSSPCAIRFPNGKAIEFESRVPIEKSLWEYGELFDDVVLCVGPRALKIAFDAAKQADRPITIVNCRSVKPLDKDFLNRLDGKRVVAIEENTKMGGFGSAVAEYFFSNDIRLDFKILAFPDQFVKHSSVEKQLERANISSESVLDALGR